MISICFNSRTESRKKQKTPTNMREKNLTIALNVLYAQIRKNISCLYFKP